jgi:hypothetical protein
VGTAFYNVINDSNPAWPDRCDDRSWMTEALNGNWLTSGSVGGLQSELAARATNATLGAEVNVAGDLTGWTPNANASITGGKLTINTTIVGGGAVVATAPTGVLPAGLYRISMTVDVAPLGGGGVSANIFTSPMLPAASAGTFVDVVSVTGGGGSLNLIVRGANALAGTVVSKISVRPISAFNTKSGDYYQLATDGKCYRLWRNLMRNSQVTTGANWTFFNVSGTATQSGNNYTFGASNVDRIIHVIPGLNIPAGLAMTASVKLSGSGSVRLQLINPDGGSVGAVAITLTATPTWYSFTGTTTASGISAGLMVYNNFAGTPGASFTIYGSQLEFGSAMTDEEVKGPNDFTQSETFRGNTAKFPRRSLWVAEATRVVGYDLTQPGNPMWMVFAGGSEFVLRASNCTSLSLREGVLYVGQQGALGTLARVNFAADVCDFYHTAGLFKRSLPTVANRNATATVWAAAGTTGISHNTINCVATATLADAPVDPATGLQAPTVAMGTASAVSLVKHDGSVIVSIGTGSFTSIVLNEFILMYGTTGDNAVRYVLNPGTALTGFTPLLTTPLDFSSAAASFAGLTKALAISRRGDIARAAVTGARLNVMRFNDMAASNSLAAAITDTFNTGWMVGDVRRCLLSDITAGTITAASYLTNGTFDLDANWNKGTGWTIAAGVATKAPGTASCWSRPASRS